MAYKAPRASLMGLPTELRIMVFRHVLHEPAIEQLMFCCTTHRKCDTRDPNSQNQLYERMRNLPHLLRLNRTVGAEVHAMRFPEWRIDFCASHIYNDGHHSYGEGRIHGPFHCVKGREVSWDLVPDFVISASVRGNEAARLEFLVRYIPHIGLRIEIEPEWDDPINTYAQDSYRWLAIDNIRCFIKVLNKCDGVKRLDVNLLFGPPSRPKNAEMHSQYLAAFACLRNDIMLDINLSHRPEALFLNEDLRADLHHPDLVNQMTHLKSSQRSIHFPAANKPPLLEQWRKLLRWTNEVFGYISRRTMHIEAQHSHEDYFVTLWRDEEREVKTLLAQAWKAHHEADQDGFYEAKQGLVAIWEEKTEEYAIIADDI